MDATTAVGTAEMTLDVTYRDLPDHQAQSAKR